MSDPDYKYKSEDDFFGKPAPAGPKYASEDAFFGKPAPIDMPLFGEDYDRFFSTETAGKLLDDFNQGFKNRWGAGPGLPFEDYYTDENGKQQRTSTRELRDMGWLTDQADKEHNNIVKEVNEAVIRPTVAAIQAPIQFLYSFAGGLANMGGVAGQVLGGPLNALLEGAIPELAVHPGFAVRSVQALDESAAKGLTNGRTTMNAAEGKMEAPPPAPGAAEVPPEPVLPARPAPTPEQLIESIGGQIPGVSIKGVPTPEDLIRSIGGPLREEEPLPAPGETVAPNVMIRQSVPGDLNSGFDVEAPQGVFYAKTREAAQQLAETLAEAAKPEPPPQMSIARQVMQRLTDTGMSEDEAQAHGEIWQAYFETKAARFDETPQEVFAREMPTIARSEEEGPRARPGAEPARGMYDLVSRTITMFKGADASTFLHESGHAWLEDFLADAKKPNAPPQLQEDVAAVKAWLQMKADRPTVAQHERWARGIERYFMEGSITGRTSPRLAGVFEQFRDWLTRLYTTVGRLNAPINDSIRDVMGRILGGPDLTAVGTTDRAVGLNFADTHEADVSQVLQRGRKPGLPSVDPDVAADRMRAERDEIAQLLPPELNNARRRSRTGSGKPSGGTAEAGRAEEGAGVSGGGEPAAGAESVGTGDVLTPTEVSDRGVGTTPESTPPTSPTGSFEPGPRTAVTDANGRPILERINAPSDVDDALNVASQGQRGVPLTDLQKSTLSEAIGINPQELPDKDISMAMDAGQIRQITQLLLDGSTRVHDLMQAVANGTGDMLEFAQAVMRLEMIQGKAVQAGHEWGMAGVALNDLKNATGTRSVEQLSTLLKQTTGRDYDSLLQLARQGVNLPGPQQVANAVRSTRTQMSLGGRKVVWWVANARLSGPITHSVYVLGNELRATLLTGLETSVNGSIGRAIGRGIVGMFKDLPEDRAFAGRELQAEMMGSWAGFKAAWPAARDAYLAGKQLPLPGQLTSPHPFNITAPVSPMMEKIFGQPQKIVSAIHQFTRVQFFYSNQYKLAVRQAMNEGLRGDDALTRSVVYRSNPDIVTEAGNRADESMYQRRAPWDSPSSVLGRMTEQSPYLKLMFMFTKIGFEFIREELVRRTPLAFASREIRNQLLYRDPLSDIGVSSGTAGAHGDEAWGRMALGTGLLATGMLLAATDNLTGDGPHDPDQRFEWLTKHQPYSVRVGPLWVPLKGLAPQISLLAFGADLWGAHHYAKDGELNQILGGYAKAIASAAFDEGFFRDMSNLTEAIHDPERKGWQFMASQLSSSVVPYSVGISQMNKEFFDANSKETNDLWSAIKARVPYLSQSVENRIDRFGNVVPSRGIRFDRYPAEASILNPNPPDPTAQWLDRLGTGPGKIDRSVWGVRLTESQYNDLEIMAGRMTKMLLDNLYKSGIENAPRGLQLKMVKEVTEVARDTARSQAVMKSLGTDNDISVKANELLQKELQ